MNETMCCSNFCQRCDCIAYHQDINDIFDTDVLGFSICQGHFQCFQLAFEMCIKYNFYEHYKVFDYLCYGHDVSSVIKIADYSITRFEELKIIPEINEKLIQYLFTTKHFSLLLKLLSSSTIKKNSNSIEALCRLMDDALFPPRRDEEEWLTTPQNPQQIELMYKVSKLYIQRHSYYEFEQTFIFLAEMVVSLNPL